MLVVVEAVGLRRRRQRHLWFRHVARLLDKFPASEQAIAAAELRFQHAAVVAERLADGGDVNLERVFFDDCAGPDLIHQIVLADEFAVGLHQDRNDLERPAAERHRHASRTQFAPREVDLPPI